MTADTPTDSGRRSLEDGSTPAPSSFAVIGAVASAERRQFDHEQLATRPKKAFGILMVAALLPVFGVVLWGAYTLGGSVDGGDGQALLSIARWYLPVSVAFYVLYGANRATNRLVGFDVRELLLTSVRERDLVLGLLYADLRESVVGLLGPTALVVAAFAVGVGSPVLLVVGTLAASVLALTSVLVGYVVGIGFRAVLVRLGIAAGVRSLLGGIGGVGAVLLFGAGGAIVGSVGADAVAESSLDALAPDGPPPIPFGYYADFLFIDTTLAGVPTGWAFASGALVLIAIPASVWSIVRTTPRLWFLDAPQTADEETATDESADYDGGERTRRSRPWAAVPSGYVADGILHRAIRTPNQLAHVLYYVVALGLAVVSTVVEPSVLPTAFGGALALFGVLLAGGAVCLNPLGEERPMLEQLVLSSYRAETFVRARLIAGLAIGLPITVIGIAVLAIAVHTPGDVLAVGVYWLLLVPVSAAGALGVGSLLPASEPAHVLERIDARPPEVLAMVVHGIAVLALALGGAALLVTDLDTTVRWGGLAAVAVGAVVFADAGYRFAVRSIDAYGRPADADPIYALELAVGVALIGLALSVTIPVGVRFLLPASGVAAFALETVGAFVGWAVAGVVYLLASGRSWDFLDVRVPSVRDGAYLVGGLLAVLLVYATTVAGITVFDAPVQSHAISDAIFEDGASFAVVMILVAVLVNGPVEEFLFRNVIQKRLGESMSPAWAILGASVVFTSIHVPSYFSADPVVIGLSLVPVFALSVIFGVLFERTDNLAVSALCHGLYNAAIFSIVLLALW